MPVPNCHTLRAAIDQSARKQTIEDPIRLSLGVIARRSLLETRSASRVSRSGRLALPILCLVLVLATASPLLAATPESEIDPQPGSRWTRLPPELDPDAAKNLPDDHELVASGAVIGEIFVRTDDIFDPERSGEDRLLFQIANRLHVTTRASVVERKILFEPGDPYDPRALQETARYLRSLEYIYDAEVTPVRYRHGQVDILVRTRDVWTLGVGAGLKRSGGENTWQFQIEESNLLGTGRFFDAKFTDDPDRRSSRVRFIDDSLLGTRAALRLWYSDNSDGHRRVLDLERPFFSLDTRWAAGGKIVSDERLERIYRQGEVAQRFFHEKTFAEVRGGLSRGIREGRTRRWLWGYTFEEDRFFTDLEFFPRREAPAQRRLSYLWVGLEHIEDDFLETRNMDQLGRTEDLNLGRELRARIGWSDPALGADESQAIFDADLRSGWAFESGQTLFVNGYASGRWGSSGHENVRVGGEVRYYLKNFGRHRLHASFRADAAWNLDPEKQLLLGGDNGLRGYPLRFQDGDRRLLLSLEQRFYTNWHLFELVHVGAAVFFDAGRAFYARGGPEALEDQGVLKDIGFGLRLSSSRSARGQMVHLDVAFPLDGDDREVQWLITSQKSF